MGWQQGLIWGAGSPAKPLYRILEWARSKDRGGPTPLLQQGAFEHMVQTRFGLKNCEERCAAEPTPAFRLPTGPHGVIKDHQRQSIVRFGEERRDGSAGSSAARPTGTRVAPHREGKTGEPNCASQGWPGRADRDEKRPQGANSNPPGV